MGLMYTFRHTMVMVSHSTVYDGKAGPQEALGLYDELLVSGQTLNTTSYNALISAYTKAGSLPNVLETFQRMFDQARTRLWRPPAPCDLAGTRHAASPLATPCPDC